MLRFDSKKQMINRKATALYGQSVMSRQTAKVSWHHFWAIYDNGNTFT